MANIALELSAKEKELGFDSVALNGEVREDISQGLDADIHVIHTHLPDEFDFKKSKIVWVVHGTPETCFQASIIEGSKQMHGSGDAWMGVHHWLRNADRIVTFWDRHRAIWETMTDRNTKVELVPMGIDLTKWGRVESRGKFAGSPSVLTAENGHYIKWPLDLFIAWPWVCEEIRAARLHALYVPMDQTRWFSALAFDNGAAYRSYISPLHYSQEDLKNVFSSVDFYVGLVRYGDHNRICLEAKACGCPVISYRGNPYTDYWLDEGDQRVMAEQLKMILLGQVPPQKTLPVPDIKETASAMIEIYKGLN